MKTRSAVYFIIVFLLAVFPLLSFSTTQVNAATAVHFLPFSASEGYVKVNATGLLYKPFYDAAGLRYIKTTYCNNYINYFCYGTNGEFHKKDTWSGVNRGAIDFSLMAGKKILASAEGIVYKVVISPPPTVNYIAIQHNDGTYSYYGHIQKAYVSKGQTVSRGTAIGEVGTDEGQFAAHLHYALWNGIPYSSGKVEIIAKFADTDVVKHSGILRPTDGRSTDSRYKNSYISSNTQSVPPTQTKFSDGSYSSLTVSLASVTLTVCSPDLSGKKVYATNYRGSANGYAAKIWRYSKIASSSCVTFSEMDGTGNTFDNVMYYTVASLMPISDANASAKRTTCWVATNHVQLCDGKSR